MDEPQTNLQQNGKIAIALAFLGAFQPTPIPFAGVHKFYLGQHGWGIIYILLGATQAPRIACAAEGLWRLLGPQLPRLTTFWPSLMGSPGAPFFTANALHAKNSDESTRVGETVDAVASSLREIERLRCEGLLSEYEFEQKRRSLLEQIP